LVQRLVFKGETTMSTIDNERISQYLTSKGQTNALLTRLVGMLQSVAPARTSVRHWWRDWTFREVEVNFKDVGFRITRPRHGVLLVDRKTIVRNVTIKHDETTIELALKELVEQINQAAGDSVHVRETLSAFLSGAGF
jgi:hypothetical protein